VLLSLLTGLSAATACAASITVSRPAVWVPCRRTPPESPPQAFRLQWPRSPNIRKTVPAASGNTSRTRNTLVLELGPGMELELGARQRAEKRNWLGGVFTSRITASSGTVKARSGLRVCPFYRNTRIKGVSWKVHAAAVAAASRMAPAWAIFNQRLPAPEPGAILHRPTPRLAPRLT